MRQKTKIIVWALALAVVIIGASFLYKDLSNLSRFKQLSARQENTYLAPGEGEKGAKAPDFSVKDMDGNSVKLSDFLGKPVVINFWASWCPPCKNELPGFEAAYEEYGESVQFMMIDVTDGQRETREDGTKYIENEGYSFPLFFDEKQEAAGAYGLFAIPLTVFIDESGNIVKTNQGAISETALIETLKDLLP